MLQLTFCYNTHPVVATHLCRNMFFIIICLYCKTYQLKNASGCSVLLQQAFCEKFFPLKLLYVTHLSFQMIPIAIRNPSQDNNFCAHILYSEKTLNTRRTRVLILPVEDQKIQHGLQQSHATCIDILYNTILYGITHSRKYINLHINNVKNIVNVHPTGCQAYAHTERLNLQQ
jgi:hypothetical protein